MTDISSSNGPVLSGRGIVKSYGNSPALRGVTVDVAPGEVIAVTGPSGCGKSTLLYCLSGILRPDAGQVSYAGERIDEWSEGRRSRLRRGDFGVLFQFGQLVDELSAVDNVALPLLLGGARRARRVPPRCRGWSGSAWRTWRGPARARCPAARRNGWRSRGLW